MTKNDNITLKCSRRALLKTAGMVGALSIVGGGAIGTVSSVASGDGHWAQVPLGTNIAFNRINNWSEPVNQSGAVEGPIQEAPGQWRTDSLIRDADVNVMEAVYGEDLHEPRKFMTTEALSQGGAGSVEANAWSALEFYTTGTTAQSAVITMSATYDAGMNYLEIKEAPGHGHASNVLDMVVTNQSTGQELGRERMWEHSGSGENYSMHNAQQQTEGVVRAINTVTVTLEPNQYYAAYFMQRSDAGSVTPISDVTDAIYPPKAYALQHVGIGYIEISF